MPNKTNKLSTYFEPTFSTLREGKMASGKYFSTTERKTAVKSDYPAPGTYFPDIFKYSSVVKKSFTKTPTFEWGGLQDRFKPKIDDSWKPPVGFYNTHKINCIDDILSKKVSKKGPYVPFTGPRDNTTIMNRFKLVPETPDKFYTLPTDLDYLLHHPVKKRYGVMYRGKTPSLKESLKIVETARPATYSIFGTNLRYGVMYKERVSSLRKPSKMVEAPGPATYNVTLHTMKVASPRKPRKAPFNRNHCKRAHPDNIAPGPGRYFLTDPEVRREGMKKVESRHLRTCEASSKRVIATPVLKRRKVQERRKLQEGGLPTDASLHSRRLIQNLVNLQNDRTSRSEMNRESQTGSQFVCTEENAWHVVPTNKRKDY